MNCKAKGSRNERKSIKLLESLGYNCTRAAASLGVFDIVAISGTDIITVSSKVQRLARQCGDGINQEFSRPAERPPIGSSVERPGETSRREGDMTNLIISKKAKPKDLIKRTVARAYRDERRGGPPKPWKPPSRSRAKEYEQRRALRRVRVMDGLCSNCGDSGLTDGFKMCLSCRLRWRKINARCRAREIFSLTPHGLRIDLD